jgi:hypothetical protein
LFKAATYNHVHLNSHHPEFWSGGIQEMSEVALAELVADWSARSSEFGTDLKEFIKDKATDKYSMTTHSRVYKDIMRYVNLLLDKPFK